MVTGTVMAGAFFGNLADTMKENREYLKAKQGMLQDYMLKAGFEERDKLKEARDMGLGVLLISADLDELLGLSDKLYVIYEGKLVKQLEPKEATPEQLGSYMTGLGI